MYFSSLNYQEEYESVTQITKIAKVSGHNYNNQSA